MEARGIGAESPAAKRLAKKLKFAIIVVGLSNFAKLAFLWGLHRDVADLRERMARLEGSFEGFPRRESAPSA